MNKYRFNTYSKVDDRSPQGDPRYDWCIFLDENIDILDHIKYIEYILHPTFPNPERTITNRMNKFSLFSNGWGNFDIRIKIWMKEGPFIRTNHHLELKDDNWPRTELDEKNIDPTLIQVYRIVEDSRFNWRKLSTIVNNSNLTENEVLEAIRELENLNLIRQAHYSSSDNQVLYGITFKVGDEPR